MKLFNDTYISFQKSILQYLRKHYPDYDVECYILTDFKLNKNDSFDATFTNILRTKKITYEVRVENHY